MKQVTSDRGLWLALTGVLVVAFTVLGFFGREVYRKAPPLPGHVVTPSGHVCAEHVVRSSLCVCTSEEESVVATVIDEFERHVDAAKHAGPEKRA